jgi:hypothetical protein
MTREEHIIYLKNLRTALKLANNFSNETMESLNKAIEALEAEPCVDAISRKWVLDVVNNFVFDTETDRNRIIHIVRDTAPSVIPKEKQEPILDKIRVDIEMEKIENSPNFCIKAHNNAVDRVLQIIDKYRAENEDEK